MRFALLFQWEGMRTDPVMLGTELWLLSSWAPLASGSTGHVVVFSPQLCHWILLKWVCLFFHFYNIEMSKPLLKKSFAEAACKVPEMLEITAVRPTCPTLRRFECLWILCSTHLPLLQCKHTNVNSYVSISKGDLCRRGQWVQTNLTH